MKTLHYSIIAILIFSTSLYIKPIQADNENGVVIQNIQTLPTAIIIGQTFKINATLINNSSNPIFVEHGSCGSPFSVTFDNHVVVRTNNVTCTLQLIEQRLDPGTKITSTSPYLDLTYVAAENGTVNATVSFPYNFWNQTSQSNTKENITKPFSFTIYPKTRVPSLTPSGNQALIDVALAIPGLQKWSNDWQFVSMGFMTAKNQPGNWQYATVNLKASSSSSLIPCDNNNEDWSAMVVIDRTTMKVIQATYPTLESHNCNYSTGGGPSTYGNTIPKIDTPLKQLKFGIPINDVKCEQGLHLVIKSEDNSPACVKLDAAYMLIKRGWATSESAYPGGDRQFVSGTNSTIIPGHLPRSSGVQIPYYESSRVINYSGFDGMYNETLLYHGTQNDYVLKPGSTGVITFKLDAGVSEQQGQSYPIPLPRSLNLTNYSVFIHEITNFEDLSKYPGVTFDDGNEGNFRACFTRPASEGTCIGGPFSGNNPIEAYVADHPGIDVLFEPPAEILPLTMNATSQVVTMTITTDSNAPRGTYLVELAPYGFGSFLLTVGDQPYHE